MNHHRIITLFILSLLASGMLAAQQGQPADSLSIEDALSRALSQQPSLEQARAQILVSQTRTAQAGLAAKPEVTAEAGYTRLDPVSELSIPGLGGMKLFPNNNYDAHITARATVYDFGKTDAAVDVSRSRVQSSADQLALARNAVAVQTQRVFYAILFLQQSIPVQDEQIAALHEHERAVKKRLANGTATQFDVLTTQVRIAGAENQKIDLLSTLERQKAEFRRLLGLAAGSPVAVRGTFAESPMPEPETGSADSALARRPESLLVRDAEETAMRQKRAAQLLSVPAVKAAVQYGFKNGFEPNFDVLRGNWAAVLKVEVPVYDGGRTRLLEEEAEAALVSEQAHRSDVERQIRSDVESALADVRAAREKVKISDIQLTQAHEAASIARTRYETGSVTNLDLLDAETAETVARHAQIQALYRAVVSTIELERALGKRY
ncbi:MAG: TolC family protein [Acidobacteriota bacterium]